MNTIMRIAAFKLPKAPYPGLRPFLDHEAALLLGRGRQVREVIGRLRETQFVAVIGGSGSGKSSLIRAGVVPELRGLGIPDAGDYWVPVICTPGTTAAPAGQVPPMEGAKTPVAQTPVTRLAWKFSEMLEAADDVLKKRIAAGKVAQPNEHIDQKLEAARRRAEIATVFGQGAGFARLVNAYSDELPTRGPAPKNARFLFVIDQFEELFHPNNCSNNDAEILIEAVIDHFFNPHPRCYVILTMRSEHLADCAGYLELPDAINKSFYLVRRLDDSELRDAIVGPAKYFLRLLQRRGAVEGSTLLDDILFNEPVIQRLLTDVAKITNDTDHLPLLQHILARTWEAACEREGVDGERQIPEQILWADLERAVEPRSQQAPGWLHEQDSVNTLRSSLENWAEAMYLDRSPERQARIDVVLRQLAFKDPNNGQYSQQRVDVDDPNLFKGVVQPRQMLRDLLECGFLDSVNYLFWDNENPDRVTLKVSHESFIRGWTHFRTLVDAEAERFDEFVAVLRKCALWEVDEKPELLLEASELMRLETSGLTPVFESDDERKGWFRVLLQYRDGERLSKVESKVDTFLAASRAREEAEEKAKRDAVERERVSEERARLALEREREAERQQVLERTKFEAERRQHEADRLRILAEKDRAQAKAKQAVAETERAQAIVKRKLWLAITAAIVVFILLPYAAFTYFIQTPVMQSVEKFNGARALVDRRDRAETNPIAGAAGHELGVLLRAAALVEEAKANVAFLETRWMRLLVKWLPPLDNPKRLFAASSSEPLVNGSLRILLTAALWRSETVPGKVDPDSVFPPVRHELDCTVTTPSGSLQSLPGSLFFDTEAGRGLFVPKLGEEDNEIQLYAASYADKTCAAGRIIWSVPRYLQPLLLLDARARYMAVALTGPTVVKPSVSLYMINWETGVDGQTQGPQVTFRSVVTDSDAVELVRREVNPTEAKNVNVAEVKSVSTWPEPGGIGVAVSGKSWRLFTEQAQRIGAPGAASDWKTLERPAAAPACASLGAALERKVQPGFKSKMFQDGDHCFQIQRGNPLPSGQGSAPNGPTSAAPTPGSQREQVVLSIYDRPRPEVLEQLNTVLPIPIAGLVAFHRLTPGLGEWVIGKTGKYEGWIALRRHADNGSEYYTGAPWSTSALRRLAEQVQKLSTGPLTLPTSAPAISLSDTPPATSPPPR